MGKNRTNPHFGGSFETVVAKPAFCVCDDCCDDVESCSCSSNIVEYSVERIYIKKVIYSELTTIVLWSDGTKTVAKCSENDEFNPETGLAICYLKKLVGATEVRNLFRDWITDDVVRTDEDITITLKDVRRNRKNN